jgi:hypothetical protein
MREKRSVLKKESLLGFYEHTLKKKNIIQKPILINLNLPLVL